MQGTTRYTGSRIARVEDPRLLTGRGTFVDDVVRPGMLHVCFVRSTLARARVLGVDVAEAAALPGVHAVLTAVDLNDAMGDVWFTGDGPKGPRVDVSPLASDEVRFVGDPVAMVIAVDRYVAEDAAELVVVDYEPLEPVVDYAAGPPDLVMGELAGGAADKVEEALASAAHVVEETIHQQAYAAVPLETRGVVAEWVASTGELTLWAATQSPHEVRAVVARALDVAEGRVRVIMRDTGGGFGQKVVPQREELAVALAARRIGLPLKWIEDRRENLLAAGQARHEHATVRMALGDDGTLLAASIDHAQDVGAYPLPFPVGPGAAVGMIFPGPYRIPATSFAHRSLKSNLPGRTAYRGPWMFESVAREVVLDVAARRIGMDPVELRRRNMLRGDELPYMNGSGMPYAEMAPLETFEHALELLDYEDFRREQAAARAEGRFLGVGTCSYVEPTTPGFGYYGSEGATIRIEPSGTVNVYVAGGSTGNSLETTVVQLTADALGVPIESVHTIQGDTAITPYGAGTGGSRSGSMLAGAVAATADVLRRRLVAIAAQRLEASADDIELADGSASVRGTPTATVSIADLAAQAYYQAHSLPPEAQAGLEATERYGKSMMPVWANATHVCTCEVDVATGVVRILRYVVAEDCGAMINPAIVEGQIAGGTVQGIGGALLEELAYDEDGNPLATTFLDYLLPTAADVPTIEYGHLDTPSSGPGGYKGVGEGGAIGAPPAVINAVADALSPFGVHVTRLPLSPSAVVGLLGSPHREETEHG
jgi:carbon-monoxide dehydrogenase large subunit